tara:strand:- start:2687 stop:3922 length:1236 start_codon:yes stop_codon:yes gene_type:complete
MFAAAEREIVHAYLRDKQFQDTILQAAEAVRITGGHARIDEPRLQSPPIRQLVNILAQSRREVLAIDRPIRVAIVFAMWKEVRRLLPASGDNPLGEDCLMRKFEWLDWLFAGTPVDWHLYAVDDDCPQDSAAVAERIGRQSAYADRLTVLRLSDGFPYATLPLSRLASLADSVKGGAIALGVLAAAQDGCDYIGFTDCDNSIHVGQFGLCLGVALRNQALAVSGERLSAEGFIFWHEERPTAHDHELLVSHMRQMLVPEKMAISDLSSALKLFDASYFRRVVERLTVFNFSFDEDLALIVTHDRIPVYEPPYVFLDSFEESTWHAHGNHKIQHERLMGVLAAARANGVAFDPDLADTIETLLPTHHDLEALLDAGAPPQMVGASEEQMGRPETMNPREIRAWVTKALGARA